jgi:hypothetical protein
MIPEIVVNRFAIRNGLSLEQSQNLHEQLDTFLSIAVYKKGNLSPSEEIDTVWHNFILDTREYANYCVQRFGKFIHHIPSDKDCTVDQCSASPNE